MATSIVCHRCNNWWLRWFWCTLWQLTRAPHEFLRSHGVVMNQAKQTAADDTWRLPVRTSALLRSQLTDSWPYVMIVKVRSVQPGVSYEKQHPRQQIKRSVKINWESPTTNWCGSKPNAGTAQTLFFFYSQFIERSISSLTSLEGKAHLDINLDYGWDGIFLRTDSIPALESRWQIRYIDDPINILCIWGFPVCAKHQN